MLGKKTVSPIINMSIIINFIIIIIIIITIILYIIILLIINLSIWGCPTLRHLKQFYPSSKLHTSS